MKERVVLLTTGLARGGAETQVALLANGLRRHGWDMNVVSMLQPGAFERELASAGVPLFSLAMQPGVPNPLGFARLARILRDLRPRILHSHMFHANLLARAARLICPAPVLISTLHSMAESGRGSKDIRRRDWLYRISDPLAGLTVAVSEAVAQRHAAAKAAPRRKLRVIPNGVDTNVFRPDPAGRERTRRSLGIGEEFAWLAAGRLMWKKGYETMLGAFAGERRGVLLIAGAGPQEAELRELAGKLGTRARFLGQRDDVAGLMAACDGFVQSSVVEGLPMTLLEASSSGLPCVATEVGGVREIVLDGRTGYLVPPADPAALAAAVSKVMDMPPAARNQLGFAAREHAIGRFGLETVVTQWERLYLEMLQGWT